MLAVYARKTTWQSVPIFLINYITPKPLFLGSSGYKAAMEVVHSYAAGASGKMLSVTPGLFS